MSGFIAQEVEQAATEAGYDFDGVIVPKDVNKAHYQLSYASFVVPLVKAVQEQQATIENLQNKILKLEKMVSILVENKK